MASTTESLRALLASTAAWISGTAKLIRMAARSSLGNRTRSTNWLRIVVLPHIMRKPANVITAVSAELAAICTTGVIVRIGPTVVNGSLGEAGLPVLRRNARSAARTSWTFSTMNAWMLPPRSMARRIASRAWSTSPMSVTGNRPGQDVHQRARHLDAQGPDDDALDPLLGLEDGLGLDGKHLPEKCDYEGQGADGADQRLADEDPAGEHVLDGLNGVGRHGWRPPDCGWAAPVTGAAHARSSRPGWEPNL
ncbi:MAG: hypothetical protein E6J41_00420 [Chloroflexi bacterium]|nr:MAG: hypothetical protein E6J41_00420 [Chloroflexota bacterium]